MRNVESTGVWNSVMHEIYLMSREGFVKHMQLMIFK